MTTPETSFDFVGCCGLGARRFVQYYVIPTYKLFPYKLFPHCNRVDLCKYFFSQRIIDTWNSLPARPNDFSSLARFKRFIRSTDLSHIFIAGILTTVVLSCF